LLGGAGKYGQAIELNRWPGITSELRVFQPVEPPRIVPLVTGHV
jgi:hypothetical protein